ncbi:myosin-2 heavy chain-like [Panicum miliaceum]|uniref:FRIGIDA-like protein n=1 Tax=Panicum miliaceum TaxID=4540 RepID=A0A3L6TI79_PANMI|nr:myosin-2 heavy chain-like [Panicum miliaceum]
MANEEMQEGDSSEADGMIGKDGKDEKEGRDEVMEEEEVVEAAGDKIGNEIKDDKDAREEMQVANEEEQSTEDGKKASRDGEDANMEEEQMQGKEQEACNEKQLEEEDEQEAHKEEQDAKNTTKEEKAKKVSQDQGSGARPGPVVFNDLAAAVTSMDARRLVTLIHTKVGLSSEFHAAMSHAPNGAALSLRVVELFLHDKTFKTNKVWNNCVGMIQTVPEVVTTESIEHAKQLAKDWKEMIDNPGSRWAMGSLSSWGLLNFLISYNIVSEFDTNEIFRIFGTIPRKQQRKNHSVLLKGLGLADRIPELMDYLIGNGQQMNALYLAPFSNLLDKYPPLCLLKGYVEKAKQTVIEISQKSMTRQSLREVIIKELDNLRMARDLAKQRITDSGLRTGIMAEIYVLLGEFGRKRLILADVSTALTSNPQQQKTESSKKRKKEQAHDHHKGQENQQEKQQSSGRRMPSWLRIRRFTPFSTC